MKRILCLLLLIIVIGCKHESSKSIGDIGPTGNTAIDELTKLIAQNPNEAPLYARRAKLFYDNEGMENAILDMAKAMAIDSNNLAYHHQLADIYMDGSNSKLALLTMERASRIAQDSVKTQLKLTEFYFILKKYQEGLSVLNEILKKDPQNAEAYFMMGMIAKEMDQKDRAMVSFQKSVDLDPNNADAYINLGNIYAEKKSKVAEKYFDNAVAIDSTNKNALHAKAFYCQMNNRNKEAIDWYRKIVEIDPHYAQSYFNIGFIYFEMDSLSKAEEHFKITVNEKPTYYKAYYYLGLISEKRGDLKKAKEEFQQSFSLAPSYTQAKDALDRVSRKL
jgi:tetratricopeptide (TPR) repeat protein